MLSTATLERNFGPGSINGQQLSVFFEFSFFHTSLVSLVVGYRNVRVTSVYFPEVAFRVFRRCLTKPHRSRPVINPPACCSLEHFQAIAVQIIGCHGNERRVSAADRRTGEPSMLKSRETLPRSPSRPRVAAASTRQLVLLIGRPAAAERAALVDGRHCGCIFAARRWPWRRGNLRAVTFCLLATLSWHHCKTEGALYAAPAIGVDRVAQVIRKPERWRRKTLQQMTAARQGVTCDRIGTVVENEKFLSLVCEKSICGCVLATRSDECRGGGGQGGERVKGVVST
jgi:hypothetical protein